MTVLRGTARGCLHGHDRAQLSLMLFYPYQLLCPNQKEDRVAPSLASALPSPLSGLLHNLGICKGPSGSQLSTCSAISCPGLLLLAPLSYGSPCVTSTLLPEAELWLLPANLTPLPSSPLTCPHSLSFQGSAPV